VVAAAAAAAAAVEFRRFGGWRVPIVHDELTPRPALNTGNAPSRPRLLQVPLRFVVRAPCDTGLGGS